MSKFTNFLRWILFVPVGIFAGAFPKIFVEYFFPVYYPIMIGNFNILNLVHYVLIPFVSGFLYSIIPPYIVPKFKFMVALLISFIIFVFITYFVIYDSFVNFYFVLSYIFSIFGILAGIFHVRKFKV